MNLNLTRILVRTLELAASSLIHAAAAVPAGPPVSPVAGDAYRMWER